jgi:hypothetical protein
MFSGVQEILLIGLLIVGVLILPRMMKPQPPPPKISPYRHDLGLTWTFRLAIVLSILWPTGWTLYFKPWHQQNGVVPFILVGMGPVVVGWCIKWVLAGMKNKR